VAHNIFSTISTVFYVQEQHVSVHTLSYLLYAAKSFLRS